ncbi:MAG: hypothetical protein IPO37_09235 [Saprospiraceae bacterium]|nr:hypothetical protein [Saprospiraceae bacterium]
MFKLLSFGSNWQILFSAATSTSFVKDLPDFDGTYLTFFDRLWTIYSGHETER